MPPRSLIAPFLVTASVLCSIAVVAFPARQTPGLPRPPGVRLGALPRELEHRPAEVSVAVNPRDPRHVIVGWQQVDRAGHDHAFGVPVKTHVAWSGDGGDSWAVGAGTWHPDYLRSLDASVTIDLHGHAFLAYLAIDSLGEHPLPAKNTGAAHNGIYVARSADGGRTWATPHTILVEHRSMTEARFEDKGYLVSDNNPSSPYAGNVYLGWTSYAVDRSEILFARSIDDGRTWSRPIPISTEPGPAKAGLGVPIGFHAAVGPDGVVFAIWSQGEGLALAVSRDGGRTFESSRRILSTSVVWPMIVSGYRWANGFPSIAVDPRERPHGRVIVVWGDSRSGDYDILSSTSSDGGTTWTKPARVNDDPYRNGKDQILSWVATDPREGAAYVLFYDRRGDPKNLMPTVTLARSTDGGRTFTNYAWSVAPSDPRQARYGDYNGLAALGGWVYGAWVENVSAAGGSKFRDPDAPDNAFGPSVIRFGIARFGASESAR